MSIPRNKAQVAGMGFVLLLLLLFWYWRHHRTEVFSKFAPGGLSSAQTNLLPSTSGLPLGQTDPLRAAWADLQTGGDRGRNEQRLLQLHRALSVMSSEASSAAIRKFLDSNADAPTGQGFKIGAGGVLGEAPTLRTFLLDYLGSNDPGSGASYARAVLKSKTSPDEWAIALRNLATGDTTAEGRGLLSQKLNEMLTYNSWQQNPSTGFLEAFDVAVFLGGTNLVPTLTDLVRKQDNQAVAHAAFLALDRLVINEPGPLLEALEASPGLMQGRERTRADYFSRADVRDPRQRQAIESYLLDAEISPQEIQQFAALFPNANFMISQNLLTSNRTPDHAVLVERDAASLQTVQAWLSDLRFTNCWPQLRAARLRLETFVSQAGK